MNVSIAVIGAKNHKDDEIYLSDIIRVLRKNHLNRVLTYPLYRPACALVETRLRLQSRAA